MTSGSRPLRSRQRVVVGVPDRADGGEHPVLGQRLGVIDDRVLTSAIVTLVALGVPVHMDVVVQAVVEALAELWEWVRGRRRRRRERES
jgi:hypothetical protein